MKRFWGLIAAAGLLGLAAAGTNTIDAGRERAVREDAQRAAEAAGLRANDGLAAHVAELKLKAQNAAANPRLAAALQGNVDAATLQDLFRSEVWWQPFRDEFKVYAIALDGEKLDVLEGMQAPEFAGEALVRAARTRREPIAEIVMGKGWPYAAAAALAPVPERAIAPVLVLAKPIDEAAVRSLAEKARGAVLLSDGKAPVLDSGDDAERERLRRAVGSESKGPLFLATDGSWAAVVSQLAPGLWMWSYGAAPHDAASAGPTQKYTIWGVCALAAAVALFLGFRRSPAPALATDPRITVGNTVAGLGGALPSTPARGSGAAITGGTTAGLGDAATALHTGPAPTPAATDGAASFGRYTLLDRLGAGGMAEVYTAVTFGAEGFRRTFVVKRLRAELAHEAAVVAQFIDEAKLGSTLVHSNIIPVFDFGKVGDEYFLAQEYILGRDMARIAGRMIERDGTALPAGVVLHVAHETLKALEYAHTRHDDNGKPLGIVHRDVSPNNVLVSARGEVKLFDFGIVKAEGRVSKTQQGVVKGNVSFMSPEQARGADVDARADLFSMGLVIFYCLTGEVLYRGNTTYELLVRAATGPDVGEQARIAALPAPCAEIVAKALQVDPAVRYQSAGEFAAALVPHITGAAAQVSRLMHELFDDELKQEAARFAAAVPAENPSTSQGAAGGTQSMVSRRS